MHHFTLVQFSGALASQGPLVEWFVGRVICLSSGLLVEWFTTFDHDAQNKVKTSAPMLRRPCGFDFGRLGLDSVFASTTTFLCKEFIGLSLQNPCER